MSLAGVETGEKILVCGDRSELATATFVADMETMAKMAQGDKRDPKCRCIRFGSKMLSGELSPPSF